MYQNQPISFSTSPMICNIFSVTSAFLYVPAYALRHLSSLISFMVISCGEDYKNCTDKCRYLFAMYRIELPS